MHRARVVFDRDIQQRSQVVQGVDTHKGLLLQPHACARGYVEHPDRDMEAVASLVAGHLAPQDVRGRAALLALDQDVVFEQGMPRIRHAP